MMSGGADDDGVDIATDGNGSDIEPDLGGDNIQADEGGDNIQAYAGGDDIQADEGGDDIQADECGDGIQADENSAGIQEAAVDGSSHTVVHERIFAGAPFHDYIYAMYIDETPDSGAENENVEDLLMVPELESVSADNVCD